MSENFVSENFRCDKFIDKLKKEYGADKEYVFDGKWSTIIKRTEKELHIVLSKINI